MVNRTLQSILLMTALTGMGCFERYTSGTPFTEVCTVTHREIEEDPYLTLFGNDEDSPFGNTNMQVDYYLSIDCPRAGENKVSVSQGEYQSVREGSRRVFEVFPLYDVSRDEQLNITGRRLVGHRIGRLVGDP